MSEHSPFDEIALLVAALPEADLAAAAAARAHDARLTKPPGALGRLEDIVEWMASWRGVATPSVNHPLVAVFAGNHGVVAQGVSAFPPGVTAQMVQNFTDQGAAINQICRQFNIGLKVYELALERPTRDFSSEAAMDEREAAATFAYGMDCVDGVDLLAPGEMGIGNTTSAAAIYVALYGGPAALWTGAGTGLDAAGVARKNAVIDAALALHRAHLVSPLQILRHVGGREIAAIMGAIVAARLNRIPVVLDGYVVCAAASLLHAMNPTALDHCVAGHVSAEGAHREILRRIGKAPPLLDLGLRLGEGSGAALAIALIKAALACHNGMATFDSAGVSEKTAP